ncbi:sensor histidine kinase [Thermoflavimicrobium daqui]|uniref:histidine kinase n=1 Tax=Thermoflavimicrobium daqui TaxID=2137476 RepID=A0A364K3K7_9BACL|nr:HAMP domain-containing sensor histidine kinase [Thermoflavimicrobium daqui]RAL23420.1 two-component sensor histidine kinase [Thermoflavimicrobium daqui]
MKRRFTFYFLLILLLLFVSLFLWGMIGPPWIYEYVLKRNYPENLLTQDYLEKIAESTVWKDEQVSIKPEVLHFIQRHKGWLQVLDENGNEIYQYRRPDHLPQHYIPGQLVSYYQFPERTGFLISTWYGKINGRNLTWILGKDRHHANKETVPMNVQAQFASSMFAGWLVITLILAFLIGKFLGSPLLSILTWLQTLSAGSYDEPLDRRGRPISQNRFGIMKRSYRIYREVIEALHKLTRTLKQNEEDRKQLEKTREEWMTGVSHDLKTPLSTIKGYVDVLSSKHYPLSEHEVSEITDILQERIRYMEDLIQDFNLTFRLKNHALPLHKQRVDIANLVQESVLDMANSPRAEKYEFRFSSSPEELYADVDPKWFKRAMDNLIGNAVIHNPPGTLIEVMVQEKKQSYQVVIRDHGKGMDEETQSRLFDRYYRGTDSGRNYSGTGLGMAIAYQLIQAHQGKMDLVSQPSHGTKITMNFPYENTKAPAD